MTPNAAGGPGAGWGRFMGEAEVRACRDHVASGQLPQAALHLGRALFHEPGLASAYAALGDIVRAAGSSDAARDLFKGDGRTVYPGNAAAIVALIAGEGRVADAVGLLGSVVAAQPEKPWAAAPWFSPDLAGSLPLIAVGKAVTAVWQAIDNPAPPESAEALAPWLALARKAADRPDADADVLCALSALARRLGAYPEAIAWCKAAEETERAKGGPTQSTLIMLGYAHRDGGQPERAVDAWTRAAALRPENTDLLLDLVDITYDHGDFDQSLGWAERAAATDRSGVKARAALLAARYRASRQAHEGGDAGQLTALVELALAHPEESYLPTCVSRACQGSTWLQTVPPPTEAVARSVGHLAEMEESGQGGITGVRSHATSLEAPTPTSLLHARFPRSTLTVPEPQEPDPRIPVTADFGPPLWIYHGTEATAAVAPPSPEAVELVHRVASGIWADPLIAFDRASAFAKLDSADLLGLLTHMPPPREQSWLNVQRKYPLYWERLAQAWVCLGILHHHADEPWHRSTRRTLLLRLLFGPEDWTVDAAAFALCVEAWRNPGRRAQIADAVSRRYLHAAQALGKRPTQLHDPLAQVVLICPGIDPKTVRLARKNLAARQDPVDDPGRPRMSMLRRWARRKGR